MKSFFLVNAVVYASTGGSVPICVCVGNVWEMFCCLTRGCDVQGAVVLFLSVNILGHVGCLMVVSCVRLRLCERLLPVQNLKCLVVFDVALSGGIVGVGVVREAGDMMVTRICTLHNFTSIYTRYKIDIHIIYIMYTAYVIHLNTIYKRAVILKVHIVPITHILHLALFLCTLRGLW